MRRNPPKYDGQGDGIASCAMILFIIAIIFPGKSVEKKKTVICGIV
jgi:hypothetical protein